MNPKKPPTPEKVALDRMGHDSVIKDLRAKYSLEKETLPLNPREIGNSSIEQLIQRQKDLEREVLVLPYTQERYSENELYAISEVNLQLGVFVSSFEARTQSLDKKSKQYQEECEKGVAEVLNYLDRSPIWKFKFSTEASGGKAYGALESSSIDSIYYMTESGISIRIKRAAIADGYEFKTVIQPFMEKIFFTYGGKQKVPMESEPTLGLFVIDYETKEFANRIMSQGGGDFVSPLVVYMKEGKPYAVAGPDDIWIHEGDRVNELF